MYELFRDFINAGYGSTISVNDFHKEKLNEKLK
jgi:hypothetical protein